jgi:hypothetical protein
LRCRLLVYILKNKIILKLITFLENLQKELGDTKDALLDLEERYKQAKCTIKEKEFLISNLLKSGPYSFLNLLKFHSFVISIFHESRAFY